jgi:hypothetical protein
MKNLFNDISQEEKNRILEMHSGKKNVISEQSIGGAIDWVKEKVKSILPSSFKAEATVEGDMVMEFPVVDINYNKGGYVDMRIKDPINGDILFVQNFEGPIFKAENSSKKYKSSYFTNINTKNWKTIAKQNKIPVFETMV